MATRPMMSLGAFRSEGALNPETLDRARERLVTERTRLLDQAPGLLKERGNRVGRGRYVV